MTKRLVVIPDTQFPYTDWKSLNGLIRFIGATKPDGVIHIGDVMDFPSPSRWSKGSAEEYHGNIHIDSETAKRRFLEPLRQVYSGPIGIHEGNHDERPRTYLAKYAPALGPSSAFHFETLLDFDGFGITKLPEFYQFAPGWVSTHGHVGGIRLTQASGTTALEAADKLDFNGLVMGHTHRGGYRSKTKGVGGNQRVISGLEVGNLMNMKEAKYLKGGTGNWQTGFGLLDIDGKHVQPGFVRIDKGKFIADGKAWSC